MTIKTIAIQGIKGAFHEEAAKNVFGNEINISPSITFQELTTKVVNQEGDYSYSTIHSLLNKIIYIGDKQLIIAIKGIQQLSIEEQDSEIKKDIIVVNEDWIILKKKIEVILITNEV